MGPSVADAACEADPACEAGLSRFVVGLSILTHTSVNIVTNSRRKALPSSSGSAPRRPAPVGDRWRAPRGEAWLHRLSPSLGFVIASLVPTARFAHPIGDVVFYPCWPCPAGDDRRVRNPLPGWSRRAFKRMYASLVFSRRSANISRAPSRSRLSILVAARHQRVCGDESRGRRFDHDDQPP